MIGWPSRFVVVIVSLAAAALASPLPANGNEVRQAGSLVMPDVVTEGLPARASATLTPAVHGRVVALQVRNARAWRTVARGEEDRAGEVRWRLDTTLTGQRLFRLRAHPTTTLPTYVSATVRVQVATLQRVSDGTDSASQPTISDDGSVIAYTAEDPEGAHWPDIRLWRRTTGVVEVVTNGDGDSVDPALSGDGSLLFFDSVANDLDGAHAHRDIFVRPVDGSGFTRLTSGNANSSLPHPTTDGSLVAFTSFATDFAPATAPHLQIYIYDGALDQVSRVTNGDGNSDFPSISDDGGRVVFSSTATDLLGAPAGDAWSDIFSAEGSVTTALAAGDGDSEWTTMSRDGSTVAFQSLATDLLGKRTDLRRDVFVVRDGTIRRLGGRLLGGAQPALSGDGSLIAFSSIGQDGLGRLVVRDLTGSSSYAVLPVAALQPRASGAGRYVVFTTTDALEPGDTDATPDVYLWDRGF